MAQLFKKGSCLIYESYGLCKLEDIREMSFCRGQEKKTYYVLSPFNAVGSTFYVPAEAVGKLRLPMERGEIDSLLTAARDTRIDWIENRQQRKDSFRSVLCEGITPKLIALIRCIYLKKQELGEKKLSATDEGIFNEAEKLVSEEFGFSLGLEDGGVTEYIRHFYED